MKKVLLLIGLAFTLLSLSVFSSDRISSRPFNIVLLPVSNQSSIELKNTISKGLDEMLIRLTGNVNISTFPAIKDIASHAQRYVQSYRYLVKNDNDNSSVVSLHLQITFNEQALLKMLKDANIPIWERNSRPKTLIWIKKTQDNQVSFLSSTIDNSTFDIVHQLSIQYGLPILLPSVDLQDLQLSQQAPLNQKTNIQGKLVPTENIFQALADRYGATAVFFGNISQEYFSQQWQSSWYLFYRHNTYQWSNTGSNESDLLGKAFKQMISTLVDNTSNRIDDTRLKTSVVFLHVSNIGDLQTYTKLSQYISRFNKTKQISIDSFSSNEAVFNIKLIGNNITALIQYLNKNQRLQFIKQKDKTLFKGDKTIQNIQSELYYNYDETTTPQY